MKRSSKNCEECKERKTGSTKGSWQFNKLIGLNAFLCNTLRIFLTKCTVDTAVYTRKQARKNIDQSTQRSW